MNNWVRFAAFERRADHGLNADRLIAERRARRQRQRAATARALRGLSWDDLLSPKRSEGPPQAAMRVSRRVSATDETNPFHDIGEPATQRADVLSFENPQDTAPEAQRPAETRQPAEPARSEPPFEFWDLCARLGVRRV